MLYRYVVFGCKTSDLRQRIVVKKGSIDGRIEGRVERKRRKGE